MCVYICVYTSIDQTSASCRRSSLIKRKKESTVEREREKEEHMFTHSILQAAAQYRRKQDMQVCSVHYLYTHACMHALNICIYREI